ncbi:DUF58 domain-containing protein [Methylomagnum ishizawai]|uniref:DUF58 domain-containing protein n=1 Tax=Methylomagnum ishizawai TaxID=1760988 RepID=UPI001C331104|nr:DUF58 domain-containing protein [Methylomagnum ishizawai]BBL73124.1 hypothetical protein MishRS11D_02220 [Methylomagnum ishizawai]
MPSPTLKQRFDLQRFFRGDKAVPGPIVLTHRLIFIVPNKRGLGLALLLFILWLTSINYSSNLGFILTFLLVAIALLGMLHGYRNLAGLSIRPKPGQPVFAGEQARLELAVVNSGYLPRYAVWCRCKGAEPVRIDIPAETTANPTLGLPATRRGWLEPGTVRVYSEFPLGLFHAWSLLNFQERVLVYPRPAPTPMDFPVSGGYGRFNRQPHSADDFHGFQAYQAGDPLRHIHWKGVAKGHDPQVKRYAGGEAEDLALVFEETPGGDTESRLSRLCRWIVDAEAAGLRYSLSLPGTRIAADCGAAHSRLCLETLALFQP